MRKSILTSANPSLQSEPDECGECKREIVDTLRIAYDAVLREPLPPELVELLKRLK